MGFDLDTKDMDRHRVELRLYLEKAKRRFTKANSVDDFETIVKNIFADSEQREADVLKMDRVNNEQTKRLDSFLERIGDTCTQPEQHELFETTLRTSLKRCRRKSMGALGGLQLEPICFFCASHLQDERQSCQMRLSTASPEILPLAQITMSAGTQESNPPTPPPSSAPTPDLPKSATPDFLLKSATDIDSQLEPPNASPEAAQMSAPAAARRTDLDTSGDTVVGEDAQVPPSPEEEPNAHEDSLQCWFQSTNACQSPENEEPRASTPLKSSEADVRDFFPAEFKAADPKDELVIKKCPREPKHNVRSFKQTAKRPSQSQPDDRKGAADNWAGYYSPAFKLPRSSAPSATNGINPEILEHLNRTTLAPSTPGNRTVHFSSQQTVHNIERVRKAARPDKAAPAPRILRTKRTPKRN